MCAISMVMDSTKQFGPIYKWTLPQTDEVMKFVKQAEKLDETFGTPDCIDPEKAKILAKIKKHRKKLRKAEKALKKLERGSDPIVHQGLSPVVSTGNHIERVNPSSLTY